MSALFAKYLHDEATASAHVEAMLWPDGPVCPHCAKKHLHRYAAEFKFRCNNREGNGVDDAARAEAALKGVKGKWLLYSDSFVG